MANRQDRREAARRLAAAQRRMAGLGDPSVESARESRDVRRQALEVLGKSAETTGSVLSGLFDLVDTPRALVFSSVKEVSDLVGGGGRASLSDLVRQTRDNFGVGDTELFKFRKDDDLLTRLAKGAGAFVGDIAFDPTTYLTAGVLPIGRKAAAEVVERGVERAAAELAERGAKEAVEAAARRSGQLERSAIARAARALARDEAGVDLALRKGELVTGGRLISGRNLDPTKALGAEAAESFLRGGMPGMRARLQELLPEDAAERLLSSLPEDLQPGLRFRLPFQARPGRRITSGRLADTEVGRLVAQARAGLANRVRGSRAGRWVADAVGGRMGQAYGEVIANLRRRDPVGMGWAEYSALRDSLRMSDRVVRRMRTASAAALADAAAALERAPDRKAAGERVLQLLSDRATLAQMDSTEPEVVAAKVLAARLDDMAESARRNGVQMGFIADYAPRVLSEQARELGVRAKALSGGDLRMGRPAMKGRTSFVEFVSTGNGLGIRWLTPDEVNRRVAENTHGRIVELFETDPIKAVAASLAGAEAALSRAVVMRQLAFRGMTAQVLRSMGPFEELAAALATALEAADPEVGGEVARRLRDRLVAAAGQGPAPPKKPTGLDRAAQVLERAARSAGQQRTDVDRAARLLRPVERTRTRLEAEVGDEFGQLMDALATAFNDVLDKVAERPGGFERSLITALGGLSDADPIADQGVKMVSSIAELLARRERESRPGVLEQWAGKVMGPVMSAWKAWATVGRGYGYDVRNLVGGIWNARLMGATVKDFQDAAAIERAAARGYAIAKKAFEAGEIPADQLGRRARMEMIRLLRKERRDLVPVARQLELSDTIGPFRTFAETLAAGFGNVDRPGAFVGADELAGRGRRVRIFPDDNRLGRAANTLVDNPWIRHKSRVAAASERFMRSATWLAAYRRTRDPLLADMMVGIAQADPFDLSPVEQRIARALVPFWSWSKTNVPLQVRAALTRPDMIAKLGRSVEFAEGVLGDPDADPEDIPEWARDRLGFITRLRAPGGSPLILMAESPALDLGRVFEAGGPLGVRPAGRELVGMGNPFIRTLIESATGRDAVTGAPLSARTEAPLLAQVPGLRQLLGTRPGLSGPTVERGRLGALEDLVPPAGLINRLLPTAPEQQERALSNRLSALAGVPVATLSPRQVRGELLRQRDELQARLQDVADRRGLDLERLLELVRQSNPNFR